ncbi:hypothetical protein EH223_00230 [candidate division KSB1 bacterium]|nr:GPW/gp25 family protein [candidate division KSB1 bacterium]RQW07347.1 MAG: hypothetical protein EH223_00230 [candidate division KSB1 bacterium]
MPQKISFLGTGWSFPPTFNNSSRTVRTVSDVDDINQSLEILLSTSLGERIMRPQYGCNLREFLFEPLDVAQQAYIKDLIKNAILYHEARIKLDDVVLAVDHTKGRLDIKLEYTVTTTNTRYNYVYPFYLQEGIKKNQ